MTDELKKVYITKYANRWTSFCDGPINGDGTTLAMNVPGGVVIHKEKSMTFVPGVALMRSPAREDAVAACPEDGDEAFIAVRRTVELVCDGKRAARKKLGWEIL